MFKKKTPKDAKINLRTTNNAARITIQKAERIRIKQEIRFLYTKKQNLNGQLFHLRL
jgi:hypothetical protein